MHGLFHYYNNMHTHSRTNVHRLKENAYAIGSMIIISRGQIYMQDYPLVCEDRATIKTFYEVWIGSELFYSKQYTRVIKRNSYTILYKKGDRCYFGKVLQYYFVNQNVIASVQRLVVTSKDPFIYDSIPMVKVKEQSLYDVINICDIYEKCVYVEIDNDNTYVCRFPSKILCD